MSEVLEKSDKLLKKVNKAKVLHETIESISYELSNFTNLGSKAFICRLYQCQLSSVETVAFTEDSLWLAVGHSNGQIDIFNTESGSLFMILPGCEMYSICKIFFLPKKNKSLHEKKLSLTLFDYRLISIGFHGIVSEWNLLSQTVKISVSSQGGAIFAADLIKFKSFLYVGTDKGCLSAYSLYNNERDEEHIEHLSTVNCHETRILSICVYDEKTVFCGTANGYLLKVNVNSDGKFENIEKFIINRPTGQNQEAQCLIWCIVASNVLKTVACGDSLGQISFWDITTMTISNLFNSHTSDVLNLILFSSDFLLSFGMDERIIPFMYSKKDQTWVQSACKHPKKIAIRAVEKSKTGLLALGNSKGIVYLYQNYGDFFNKPLTLISPSSQYLEDLIDYSPLKSLIIAKYNYSIDIWSLCHDSKCVNLKKIITVEQSKNNKKQIRCCAVNRNGTYLAFSSDDGTQLLKIDLATLSIKECKSNLLKNIICNCVKFCFMKNKDFLILTYSRASDHLLCLYDIEVDQFIAEFFHESAIKTLIISYTNEWIICQSFTNKFYVYNLLHLTKHATINLQDFLQGSKNPIISIAPNESHIIFVDAWSKDMFIYSLNNQQTLNVRHSKTQDDEFSLIEKVPGLSKHVLIQNIKWVKGIGEFESILIVLTAKSVNIIHLNQINKPGNLEETENCEHYVMSKMRQLVLDLQQNQIIKFLCLGKTEYVYTDQICVFTQSYQLE